MSTDLKVKVTAYKGCLAIETLPPFDKTDTFIPAGQGNFGCVLMGTTSRLGVSKEALALLKTVKKSRDSLGDVMWWKLAPPSEGYCFGWIGGVLAIQDPTQIEGDRDFAVHAGQYVTIPNDTVQGAKDAIDAGIS